MSKITPEHLDHHGLQCGSCTLFREVDRHFSRLDTTR
jgi:hypothetical protein